MKTIPTAILELFAEGSKIIMWMELDISYRDLKNNPIVETIIWGYINPMKKISLRFTDLTTEMERKKQRS